MESLTVQRPIVVRTVSLAWYDDNLPVGMKMTMKLLAVAMSVALALAACGGGSEMDSPASLQPRLLSQVVIAKGDATFTGKRVNYTIGKTDKLLFTVKDNIGGDGNLILTPDIIRLHFADNTAVALDLAGTAGKIYRLYKAAFNRVPDLVGQGYQMDAIDAGGLSKNQVAKNFIASPEFYNTYGVLDNTQFVTQLYQNVLGRAPDDAGLKFHVDGLNDKTFTRSMVLEGFAESPENQAAVNGAIQYGIAYIQAPVTYPKGFFEHAGLVWSPTDTSKNLAEALSYCASATLNSESGWRLPTVAEMEFMYRSRAMNGQGWSLGKTWSNAEGIAYTYNFNVGLAQRSDPSEGNYVSCVKAPSPIRVSREYIQSDGLTWMPVSIARTWSDAYLYCAGTTINGESGWRMPRLDELTAFYNTNALAGKGWVLDSVWSTNANPYSSFNLGTGITTLTDSAPINYVSCVR